jgi:hypothetical protein
MWVTMRKATLTAMFLLLSTLTFAQLPSANVFIGYSYSSLDLSSIQSNLNLNNGGRANANGWEASFEGKIIPFLGLVGDFSGDYTSQSSTTTIYPPCPFPGTCKPSIRTINVGFLEQNFLFGPRASISLGKLRPFAEAFIGASHLSAAQNGSDSSFASAVGGGLDYRLIHFLAWRFEGDYVHTRFFSSGQNNARLSTGIVLRF